MGLEETKTNVIICHENGEQFRPSSYICTYLTPDGELEGAWRHHGISLYQYLLLHAKTLKGLSETLELLLQDLATERSKEATDEHSDD